MNGFKLSDTIAIIFLDSVSTAWQPLGLLSRLSYVVDQLSWDNVLDLKASVEGALLQFLQ